MPNNVIGLKSKLTKPHMVDDQCFETVTEVMLQRGMITVDDNGHVQLTARGRESVERQLKNKYTYEQILLNLHYAERYGVDVHMF